MTPKSKPHHNTHLNQDLTHFPTPPRPSDFAFTLTQVAVSQICQSAGFTSAQLSALETLTVIATLYLKTLSNTAVSYSNNANRTQSNLLDIIHALHDLSVAQGFVGAPTLHITDETHCLLSSNVLKDIRFFVKYTDEIPFAKPIPKRYGVPSPQKLKWRGKKGNLHIPRWLPGFPEERTYKKKEEVGGGKNAGDGLGLWEKSSLVENGGELKGSGNEVGGGGRELEVQRGRVRFKIGGRSGVKRVFCDLSDNNFVDGEDHVTS